MGRGAGGFCTSPKGAGGICTTSRRCRYNFGMSRLQDAAAAAPTPAVPAVPAAVIAPWIGGSSGSTRHICLPVSWGTGKQQLCCHLVHQLWVLAARSFAAALAAAALILLPAACAEYPLCAATAAKFKELCELPQQLCCCCVCCFSVAVAVAASVPSLPLPRGGTRMHSL